MYPCRNRDAAASGTAATNRNGLGKGWIGIRARSATRRPADELLRAACSGPKPFANVPPEAVAGEAISLPGAESNRGAVALAMVALTGRVEMQDSNLQLYEPKSYALPIELISHGG